MSEIPLGGYLVTFMINTIILAGIPLAVATTFGLLVSFFQAITQIQDQTLSQTLKITAIAVVLLSFGGALVAPLITTTTAIFSDFGEITH
ncbi:MAG: flagellar biosynthetic protein FliQ [Pseudomonadota bacterium]